AVREITEKPKMPLPASPARADRTGNDDLAVALDRNGRTPAATGQHPPVAGETVSRPLCAATRERGAGHDRDQQRAGDGKQSPAASRCADVPGDGPHLILRWRAGLSLVAPTAS